VYIIIIEAFSFYCNMFLVMYINQLIVYNRHKKPQYIEKTEDLNRIRMSRFKLER